MAELRALIVDDASFVRDMIKRALRAAFPQLSLEEAVNGRRAQLLMGKMPFDLILCDWEMPEMSGLELLQWARRTETYQKTPFIMITSRGDRDHVVEAVKEGVSDYLSKPFSNEQLLQKVLKAIGKKLKLAPPPRNRAAANPFNASASVLAAGTSPAPEAQPQVPGLFKDSANLLTAAAKPAAEARPKTLSTAGVAQVRFADTSLNAVIKGITLTEVRLIARREVRFPGILDQAVVDIALDGGEVTARLNGYVHSLQAVEKRMDSDFVSVLIRFVDEDPEKLEHLSRFIARQAR